MLRALLGVMAISCAMLLAPFARAQQESDHPLLGPTLTHEQLESVQIELLERGFVTNFNPHTDAEWAALADAVAKFQAKNNMPVTGQIDAQTMSALDLPNPKSGIGTYEAERAKPSK